MNAGQAFPNKAPFAFGLIGLEPSIEPGDRRRRSWPAQLEVQRPDGLQPGETLVALAASQRMLGERKQWHRCEVLGRG